MVDFYSLNLVVLVGYIAGEIEHGRSRAGVPWARFTLATNEIFKDNERHAEFHRIVVWGKKADIIVKWGSKGKCLQVDGKLRHTRFRNEDERDEYATHVALERFTWLGRKKDFEWPGEEGKGEDEPI